MDEMVLETQQWLNETYKGRHGYNKVPENGKNGLGYHLRSDTGASN
ncbi:uncharacterized protein SRCM101294_03771 [Bacillus amyloliquefaciens]|nr:uncharacterized protein SRCM101294_03771 [Bacillus amyloliquefaciens]